MIDHRGQSKRRWGPTRKNLALNIAQLHVDEVEEQRSTSDDPGATGEEVASNDPFDD